MTMDVAALALADAELTRLVAEDCPYGDLTTEALGIGAHGGRLAFRARAAMVVAGTEEAARMFVLAGARATVAAASATKVDAGGLLLTAEGSAGDLHRVWKVAQTFAEIWSGVATSAAAIVAAATAVRGDIRVACTRKNVPGTKAMAVKAVKAGGAMPHRLGLSETILVFAEHRLFLDRPELAAVAARLRQQAPEKKLIIEVADLDAARDAAAAGFDVIQTERFSPEMIAALVAALARQAPHPVIAAAGGVNAANAGAYAAAGADLIVTSAPYWAKPADVKVVFER